MTDLEFEMRGGWGAVIAHIIVFVGKCIIAATIFWTVARLLK